MKNHPSYFKLLPAAGPLEFVAMDLLGSLPKSEDGNFHVLVITDRFYKLCRNIPLGNIKASTVSQAFLTHLLYPYGLPLYLLTANAPQFASKFFAVVCQLLGVKTRSTTAYHPQAKGKVERFYETLVQRLRHYVAENQRDWDRHVEPSTYAYNYQVHRTTGTTPFDLVLTQHPLSIHVSSLEAVDFSHLANA